MNRSRVTIVWVSLLLAATSARAQPRLGSRVVRSPPVVSRAVRSDHATSLQNHLATAVADRLLASDDPEERLRGVERLAASGEREAIDRLVHALADGSSSLRDPRARLTAIRGLVPFTSRDSVRQVLAKALAAEAGGAPLMLLVRDTAALALAASDDPRSLEVLGVALRQGGGAGEAAAGALLAYPPASLAPLGVGREDLPAAVSDLLGRLGDHRAVLALRGTLVRGILKVDAAAASEAPERSIEEDSRRAKVAAAMALARLGDQEQVAVARSWLTSGDGWLKLRGVEVLLLGGAPDARRGLLPLLAAKETRAAALRLALETPGPELLGSALQAVAANDDSTPAAVLLLGRMGGSSAVAKLEALLADSARAWDAAFALARAPGDDARRALERAQAVPALARLAARAGTMRALSLGDTPHGLVPTLERLFGSRDAADRATGAFGLAALGKVSMEELVASRDLAVVRAAARAALVLGPRAARACTERLANETDASTRVALAISLAGSEGASTVVSTQSLLTWAGEDGPIAPLAIVALGAREQLGEERTLARWAESDDPILRAHAALALGSSPLPSAVSRLGDSWRFEPDPSVRRAIVTALAARHEPRKNELLDRAARLDPDLAVREMASLGRVGQLSSPVSRLGGGCAVSGAVVGGCYFAWISLAPSGSLSAPSAVGSRLGSFVDASGLSLPVVSDPDGALVVPGVSAGNASFRLASSAVWDDASDHERRQTEPVR